jgi:hypothetical protein
MDTLITELVNFTLKIISCARIIDYVCLSIPVRLLFLMNKSYLGMPVDT